MKKILQISIISFFALVAGIAFADTKAKGDTLESVNQPDFDKAYAAAKKDGQMLVVEFSGITWCPPCMMLHKNAINTPEFIKYAKEKLQLVLIDYQRNGTPTNSKMAKAYDKLSDKYKIEGFPTLIIINPKNDVTETIVGYQTTTPKALIKRIESVANKKK